MNYEPMKLFLSESNIKRHLDHLREERLRYSILEKSLPMLNGKSISQIVRLNINREIKDEAISRLWYIKAHECFFNSFCNIPSMSDNVQEHYKSREKFVFDLYTDAVEAHHGFLFVYLDRQGVPKWIFADKYDGAFIRYEPILALDLYEHAYFLDYGFEKKLFLRNALMYLNLASLDNRS